MSTCVHAPYYVMKRRFYGDVIRPLAAKSQFRTRCRSARRIVAHRAPAQLKSAASELLRAVLGSNRAKIRGEWALHGIPHSRRFLLLGIVSEFQWRNDFALLWGLPRGRVPEVYPMRHTLRQTDLVSCRTKTSLPYNHRNESSCFAPTCVRP